MYMSMYWLTKLGEKFPNIFLILYCIYCSWNIFWRIKHLIIFLLHDILADLITMKIITQKNDFKKKKTKNTSWQNFISNILYTHTLWLRHPVCLLSLSCFQLFYDLLFLFICRSYTNYTYFRFVFKPFAYGVVRCCIRTVLSSPIFIW